MGRTIPSITLAMREEIEGWKPFRMALDKADRKAFDNMTDIPHLYRSSCMMSANPIVIHPIFMSIIFHHYKQLHDLVTRVECLDGSKFNENNEEGG
jgi:hypothetical protein